MLASSALMKNFLSKFDQGSITDEQIAFGMHFSYRNARRLFREAWLLTIVGSFDRAMALCVLSLEELGKIPLLLNAILLDEKDLKAWKEFWRKLRSHPSKQAVWSHYGRRLEQFKSPDTRFFQDKYPHGMEPLLDKLKQCGFYVSYFDGRFMEPRTFAISNWKWLRYLLGSVRNRIRAFKKMHGTIKRSKAVVSGARALMKMSSETPEGR